MKRPLLRFNIVPCSVSNPALVIPFTHSLLIVPGWLHFAPLHSIAFQKLLLFLAYSVALHSHVTSCDILVGSM